MTELQGFIIGVGVAVGLIVFAIWLGLAVGGKWG